MTTADSTAILGASLRHIAEKVMPGKTMTLDRTISKDRISQPDRQHSADRLAVLLAQHPNIRGTSEFASVTQICKPGNLTCQFPGFDVAVRLGEPRFSQGQYMVPIQYAQIGEDANSPRDSAGVRVYRHIRRVYHYSGFVVVAKDALGRWVALKYVATEFD